MKRILLAIALLFVALPAFAAVTANSVVTAQAPNRGNIAFLNASTPGTYATLYSVAVSGYSKVNGLVLSLNDATATHIVTCGLFNGGTQYSSVTFTTAVAGAGLFVDTNLLPYWYGLPIDSDGNPYINLVTGDTIQCTFATTITSGKTVTLYATAQDF